MLRRLVTPTMLAAAAVTVSVVPAAAENDTTPVEPPESQDVVSELQSDGVFIDPNIEGFPDADEQILADTASGSDAYYVLLPEGAVTSNAGLDVLMDPVMSELGDGVYSVFTGSNNLEVVSPNLDETETAAIQQAAEQEGGGNHMDTLVAIPEATTEAEEAQDANATSGFVLLAVLVLLIGAGGWYVYNQRKKREAEKAKQLEEIKQMATEDVVRLGEDVSRFEIDLSTVDEATREDYTRAMDSYDQAKSLLDTIQEPDQVRLVTGALEDGRYYMSATRARLNGEKVPERRGPCFFNPQHGPSTQDVTWAPPGGSPREVTACDQCAQAVRIGGQPDVRMVEVDGERRPYYDASPAYSPYAGGYFGLNMMTGMFTGMMMGSMMGSIIGAGTGDFGGDFDGGGFGDFGGFDGGGFGDLGGFDF